MGTADRVLELVATQGPLTATRIAQHLGVHRRTLYYHLKALEKRALLRMRRHGRNLIVYHGLAGQVARATLPRDQEDLLAWLEAHPGRTQTQVVEAFQEKGCKRSTIQYRLQRLERLGLAHRRGAGRGAPWHAGEESDGER